MRDKFLPFSPPLIGEEEISEVIDTLKSDWITTGPKVKRFEDEFLAYVGSPAALATSSATDAMLVGLAALGVGEGDEVIIFGKQKPVTDTKIPFQFHRLRSRNDPTSASGEGSETPSERPT